MPPLFLATLRRFPFSSRSTLPSPPLQATGLPLQCAASLILCLSIPQVGRCLDPALRLADSSQPLLVYSSDAASVRAYTPLKRHRLRSPRKLLHARPFFCDRSGHRRIAPRLLTEISFALIHSDTSEPLSVSPLTTSFLPSHDHARKTRS